MKFKFSLNYFCKLLDYKNVSNFAWIVFLCLAIGFPFTTQAQTNNIGTARDGKLLRSELWQPFDAKAVKGDFLFPPMETILGLERLKRPMQAKQMVPSLPSTERSLPLKNLNRKSIFQKTNQLMRVMPEQIIHLEKEKIL